MAFKNQTKRCSESGFSLIEVSIALMVIALLMLPIIRTYTLYIESKKLAITTGVTSISRAAVLKYFEKYGVYPTPANPSIAQGVAGFGAMTAGPWPACTAASTVVCQTAATGFGSGANAGIVLIGDVPFAALGIPFTSIVDGYGRKLKYAVTLNQTTAPFNENSGAIEIMAIGGTVAAPVAASIYPTPATPRSHFAIISMGQNGVGGFTLAGLRPFACNTSVAPIPTEHENCDNDGVFRNNVDQMAGFRYSSGKVLRFDVAGVGRFDDIVTTTNTSSYGLWSFIPNTLQDMQVRSTGNIRVGACPSFPCVPTSHMDVDGNVLATTVETTRICPGGEASCTTNIFGATPTQLPSGVAWFFSPTLLTGAPATEPPNVAPTTYTSAGGSNGAGIRCYQDAALKGIRNYDEVCAQSATSGITSAARLLAANTPVGPACSGTNYAIGITINAAGNGYNWICGP